MAGEPPSNLIMAAPQCHCLRDRPAFHTGDGTIRAGVEPHCPRPLDGLLGDGGPLGPGDHAEAAPVGSDTLTLGNWRARKRECQGAAYPHPHRD
jgi:hypothetical protein